MRKLVVDGFQQKAREKQARMYENLFLYNMKLMSAEEEPTKFEQVDLAPHLSCIVRGVISRREVTTWYCVLSVGPKKKLVAVIAKERTKTVVDYAVE